MTEDIRWEQRFQNYNKALDKLKESVAFIETEFTGDEDLLNSKLDSVLNEMIKEGLIQRFEYTHELAWNVMKDYAAFQGNAEVGGSRDATREAFQLKLIADGHVWMEMIKSRNQTSHTYNEEIASEIYNKIIEDYFPAFISFQQKMEELRTGTQGEFFA